MCQILPFILMHLCRHLDPCGEPIARTGASQLNLVCSFAIHGLDALSLSKGFVPLTISVCYAEFENHG